MCVTCGCGKNGAIRIDGEALGAHEHEHVLADGTRIVHRHEHGNDAAHGEHMHIRALEHGHDIASMANAVFLPISGKSFEHTHAAEHGHAHTHTAVPPAERREIPTELVRLETALLDKNQRIATRNRIALAERGVLALNLMSSPGAGKTSLLVRTLTDLAAEIPMSVVEGDQETSADAERIRATGARAVQINTGAGCHLEADMLERALHTLSPAEGSVLFIENVGNLVCPALFDLGEYARIVVLSVTEGDDKPLKYPHMFRSAQLMLLTKIDLLPYVSFDPARAEANAREVNPQIQCLRLSVTNGEGLANWYQQLRSLLQEVATESVA